MEVNLFTFTLRGSPCTNKAKKKHLAAFQQKTMEMLGIPISVQGTEIQRNTEMETHI